MYVHILPGVGSQKTVLVIFVISKAYYFLSQNTPTVSIKPQPLQLIHGMQLHYPANRGPPKHSICLPTTTTSSSEGIIFISCQLSLRLSKLARDQIIQSVPPSSNNKCTTGGSYIYMYSTV